MRPARRFQRTVSVGRLSLGVGWELYREPSWDLYVRLRFFLIPPGARDTQA